MYFYWVEYRLSQLLYTLMSSDVFNGRLKSMPELDITQDRRNVDVARIAFDTTQYIISLARAHYGSHYL